MQDTRAPLKLRTNIYRGCRRCGGVLRMERNLDSATDSASIEYVCLQCGRHTPLADVVARIQAEVEGHAA